MTEQRATKRRLAFRQCDERALRAAKAVGAGVIVVNLDGSLHIRVDPGEASPVQAPIWPEGLAP